ncbi:hypothetical protein [Rhizobium sp. YTUHZ045]|uniref:hypothetical protein n=1 Tax=Rhizobium sp. YTUHZ045 TaxID=2962888 RepID=UPI003DA96756
MRHAARFPTSCTSWLALYRAGAAGKSPVGEAPPYIAEHRDGLCALSLTDGRIESDNNSVETAVWPRVCYGRSALSRHGSGAETWAAVASLIGTYKLNATYPQAYLTSTLTASGRHLEQSGRHVAA